jgi:hypothetical protein
MQIEPLTKEIEVPHGIRRSSRRFTEEITMWWPLKVQTVFPDQTSVAMFEPVEGGRIFETAASGEEADWGRVLVWDPPGRFVFTWHPGRPVETAQEIELTFERVADGRTRLRLIHSGWERFGPGADEARAEYDPGWDGVLERFVDTLDPARDFNPYRDD